MYSEIVQHSVESKEAYHKITHNVCEDPEVKNKMINKILMIIIIKDQWSIVNDQQNY